MRPFPLLLASALMAWQSAAQASEPVYDGAVVYVKVEELDPLVEGKSKVLAEPVLAINVGKAVTFNVGREVPMRTPLGNGLETIDYVPIGVKLELTCERISGNTVWLNLVTESTRVVDGQDGLFTVEANSVRKRGTWKLGKTLRTEPIKTNPERNQRIRFEFRIETIEDPVSK